MAYDVALCLVAAWFLSVVAMASNFMFIVRVVGHHQDGGGTWMLGYRFVLSRVDPPTEPSEKNIAACSTFVRREIL
eukprot:SAG31_NODE_3078_length_4708_cov_1.870471_7_plen_76_part_00